ncbi:nucleotide disphospho-sugar-binding domain-containing protein [Aestuariispira insulae]|uniref:UDP:flavonoid glycosyltransferase YjiC (YdhE family) n=1 Tax=Aestuariispira insulae TaxID=1461337 RepID=A0A3D9H3Z1_9PROT|nr:glycosyltransferase [Aestuariispira insulae]RED44200.1 UDP:flavonoid glycosyltransferase YjiC (YdhE family) [Aestuariispira insulae]
MGGQADFPILLSCVGTMGDLMPVLATGKLMASAGHPVEIMANEVFRDHIERSGIGFHPIGDKPAFDAFVGGAAWRDKDSGWAAFLREGILPCVAPAAHYVETFAARHGRRCLIVPNNYSYGARWAARAARLPLLNLAIQPGMLRGLNPAQACGIDLLPGEKASYWRSMRAAESYLYKIYGKQGTGSTTGLAHLFREAEPCDPDENYLALFPEWFECPSPDWPDNFQQTGFPLIDTGVVEPLSDDVEAFLAAGADPVGLFCGSFMQEATLFFERGLEACRAAGKRSLIISRYPEDLPSSLPDDCLVVSQAPFGQLLPRLSALIHHGGIGTVAQGMAAGLPQLIMPLRFEQPDNADGIVRLGGGRVVPLGDSADVGTIFKDFLAQDGLSETCEKLSASMRLENPFNSTIKIMHRVATAHDIG